MANWKLECQVAADALKDVQSLSCKKDKRVKYLTCLLLLHKQVRHLETTRRGQQSPLWDRLQDFFSRHEAQQDLETAKQMIRSVVASKDRRNIARVSQAIGVFRKKKGRRKKLNVGYGQLHRPVGGGAPDSNRRKH